MLDNLAPATNARKYLSIQRYEKLKKLQKQLAKVVKEAEFAKKQERAIKEEQ